MGIATDFTLLTIISYCNTKTLLFSVQVNDARELRRHCGRYTANLAVLGRPRQPCSRLKEFKADYGNSHVRFEVVPAATSAMWVARQRFAKHHA
jgi:hypothetical protein